MTAIYFLRSASAANGKKNPKLPDAANCSNVHNRRCSILAGCA
jgi:hypothetical protein